MNLFFCKKWLLSIESYLPDIYLRLKPINCAVVECLLMPTGKTAMPEALLLLGYREVNSEAGGGMGFI